MYKIRTTLGNHQGERMQIKAFKTQEAMQKFLDTGDHAHDWQQVRSHMGEDKLKPGTYVMAGGKWWNIKSMDPALLAHF